MEQGHIRHRDSLMPVEQAIPNLPKRLFWEFNLDKIDWKNSYVMVIERVIDRGFEDDWRELFRYYGYDVVLDTLKNEPIYLMDHSIEEVCTYFKLKPEELRCYRRKRSRPGHWI